jgi:hypothetical protein
MGVVAVSVVLAACFACLLVFDVHGDTINLKRIVFLSGFIACAPLYLITVAGSIKKYPWKWFLLVFMVVGTIGISLVVPANFVELACPVMLFLGLVWLTSGCSTLILYMRYTKPSDPQSE